MRILHDTDRKARKEHQCQDCFSTIKVGEVYRHAGYVSDDRAYTYKTCHACVEIVNIVYSANDWNDWGVGPEEFLEWAIENHELPGAAAYLERVGYEYPDD